MTRLFSALIALLAFGGISHAQPTSWEPSYQAGYIDGNGHFVGGTELRELVPWHPGAADGTARLYASNGYWEDVPGPEGFQTAQILVLDNAHGVWRQDVDFGSFCPNQNPPRCALAVSAFARLSFSADKNLTPVNVQVLVAGTWDVRTKPVPVNVYTKNNSGPCPEGSIGCHDSWWETQLGAAPFHEGEGVPQVRSFGAHVDAITKKDWAFAGESPRGIARGLLSDKRGAGKNVIEWQTDKVEFSVAEYAGPSCGANLDRITSFAEVGGRIFVTMCYQVFVRVDGQDCQDPVEPKLLGVLDAGGVCQKRWKVFWTDPRPAAASQSGLRGLTKAKFDDKDVLLVGGEGGLMRIYRIDPATGASETELELVDFLANSWNLPLGYVIAAYNNMPAWYPETGATRRIIGVESFIKESSTAAPAPNRSFNMLCESGDCTAGPGTGVTGKLEGDAWYILRNAADSYEVVHIPQLVPTPMVAVRTAAQSPFSEDCNAQGKDCAIYFGGFDANFSNKTTQCFVPPCTFPPLLQENTHNTAWIVKGLFQSGASERR